ncbi:hypothetical protein lerEdw1_001614 [Lerista edwardsae]|nr:hypothetical protein lerEdw1_001614 [Lerista edwardsae]
MGVLEPALAAGLVAISLAHCFGEISGAQVNPALTVAFLCTRKLDALHAVSYILAQCLGAIMASGIFYFMLPTSAIRQLVTKVSSEGNAGQALGMEAFSTFQLALTIFAVEDHRKRELGEPGSLAIGFSVIVGALAAVYWLGPILGAVLAGVSYEFFFASSASRDKLVACLTCRDIEMVEVASMSRSSLSAPTPAKPPCKGEHSTE